MTSRQETLQSLRACAQSARPTLYISQLRSGYKQLCLSLTNHSVPRPTPCIFFFFFKNQKSKFTFLHWSQYTYSTPEPCGKRLSRPLEPFLPLLQLYWGTVSTIATYIDRRVQAVAAKTGCWGASVHKTHMTHTYTRQTWLTHTQERDMTHTYTRGGGGGGGGVGGGAISIFDQGSVRFN